MKIASPDSSVRYQMATHNHDVRIAVGYVLLTIVAVAAIYFAAGQPGFTQADLAIATAFP